MEQKKKSSLLMNTDNGETYCRTLSNCYAYGHLAVKTASACRWRCPAKKDGPASVALLIDNCILAGNFVRQRRKVWEETSLASNPVSRKEARDRSDDAMHTALCRTSCYSTTLVLSRISEPFLFSFRKRAFFYPGLAHGLILFITMSIVFTDI
ncbi:hypothetical protein BC939DRAFT_291993 [Gamsiella multidivaricata]|uniref:uncharacterized protein n=1 Tax=Gamsiella multidivaricata TaxID=101098 RepID=UPI0022208080|nr:uncharacterized protein BC939DRAFT_291993 [Gamsiella multidivaricata]KAI7818439.1 hypothetical protein BC939DRAFT_291993 [Gamsiella multidivaricata]